MISAAAMAPVAVNVFAVAESGKNGAKGGTIQTTNDAMMSPMPMRYMTGRLCFTLSFPFHLNLWLTAYFQSTVRLPFYHSFERRIPLSARKGRISAINREHRFSVS